MHRPITIRLRSSQGRPQVDCLCTTDGLARFVALLRSVAASNTIRLEDVPDVELQGIASFVWSVDARPFLRRGKADSAVFELGGTAEEWETRAQLIEPLDAPGTFQHLDYEWVGDAGLTVEVVDK